MRKKFIVRLTEEERASLEEVAKKLTGSREKIRRANILCKADAQGPNWSDGLIAEAFNCTPKTVENVRRRFVENGLEELSMGCAVYRPLHLRSSMVAKKPRSSHFDSGLHRKVFQTGHYGC